MKRLGPIVAQSTELGITMGLASAGLVVGGLLAGRWLDARLGTGRLASIGLTVLGAVAGQWVLYRLALQTARRCSVPAVSVGAPSAVISSLGLAVRMLALLVVPGLLGLGLGLALDASLGSGIGWTLVLTMAGFLLGLAGVLRQARLRRSHHDPNHLA
ncbi:MAG: AtpZ/AtpI family protein [Chloroflexota bacterium]